MIPLSKTEKRILIAVSITVVVSASIIVLKYVEVISEPRGPNYVAMLIEGERR